MFCKKCGAEIDDEAVICPKCGCKTDNFPQKEESEDDFSIAIVIFGVLFPLVGVIAGIVNLCRKRLTSGLTYLIIGILCWGIWTLVSRFLMVQLNIM